MKLYESAFTYFPFLYLFTVASLFGGLYHNTGLQLYQPYLIMIFLLINTFIYYYFDNKKLIKALVHRHVWRTVTLSIYGILINNVHTEMFRDFHFTSWGMNITVSLLYLVTIFACRFLLDNDSYIVLVHIVFSFFPLQRVWQVNLYIYIVFTTLSIILLFRRVFVKDLKSETIHMKPVINYFMYLRIYDMFVIFGVLQLYLDLYMSQMPEIKAAEEIKSMMKDHRDKIGRYDEEKI